MKIKDYMTIGEAAEYLGVSIMTLRRWDSARKLRAYRNPLTKHRLYKKADLDRLLKSIAGQIRKEGKQ